jgi:ribosome-associated translation inhibitor RaiA
MNFVKDNIKIFIVFVISLSLSLIFIEPLGKLLLKIDEILDYNSVSFKIGYYSIFFTLFLIYGVLINKAYIHNKRVNFLVFYTVTIYLFLRFVFPNYIDLELKRSLVFSDLLLLFVAVHLINLVMTWTKEEERENKIKAQKLNFQLTGENSNFFIEDKIFTKDEIDNEAILQKLISVVTHFKPEEAFSIGLNAVWGYGKSSFLHKFKKDFESKNPKEIVFWYRIWKNKGSSAIIENFFEELKNQLKPYSGEITDDINNYVDSILSLSNSELHRIISAGKDLLSENETLENFYTSINDNIKKIDKQIIILLDDLDRLESSEIMNTLKLIRTLSDFNNIIFIAGYDRKYVVETIKLSKDNYIDKIFNVEINLLPFDSHLIITELFRQVDNAFSTDLNHKDRGAINEAFKNLFQDLDLSPEEIAEVIFDSNSKNTYCRSDYKLRYQDFLPTYRDVKRFINEFKFNFSFLDSKSDVVPQEYILYKLLVYKYRNLNDLVFSNLEEIMKRTTINQVNDDNIVTYGSDHLSNVYEYNIETEEKLKEQLVNYSQKDIQIINTVLCRLFGKKTAKYYQSNQNSISKIYYTDIYLRNNILSGRVSVTQLQKAYANNKLFGLTKRIAQTKDNIDYHTSNEIKQFIYNNIPTYVEQYLDALRAINFILPNSNSYDDQKNIDIMRNAFHSFYSKDKNLFINDIQKIINVDSLGFLDFMLRDINIDLKRKKSGLNYGSGMLNRFENNEFSELDLKTLFLEKLKYVIKIKGEPNVVTEIYDQHVEAIVEDKKIIRSNDLNIVIKNDIEDRFTDYFNSSLFTSIRERISDNEGEFVGYAPNFNLAQIFSNQSTLHELIEDPFNIDLYQKFYQEGWRNLYQYLLSINLSDDDMREIDSEKFEKAKKFVKAYIKNEYKPLSKSQYDLIVNDSLFQ